MAGKIQIIQSENLNENRLPFHHNWVYFSINDELYLDAVFPEDFLTNIDNIDLGQMENLDLEIAEYNALLSELEITVNDLNGTV